MTELLSVIIPTYNEKENVLTLIPRLAEVLKEIPHEIIIVDDNSPDGTSEAVRSLLPHYPQLRVITRVGERGLSSAVIRGFNEASGSIFAVMDADLSHDEKLLPVMYAKMKEHDMAIGSRYVEGGGSQNWPFYRKVISKTARAMAMPITSVKDPLSGFFMVKKKVIEGKELDPIGYKIGLEILAKGDYNSVVEVPMIFRDRAWGKSKLGNEVIAEYGVHVLRLTRMKMHKRMKKMLRNISDELGEGIKYTIFYAEALRRIVRNIRNTIITFFKSVIRPVKLKKDGRPTDSGSAEPEKGKEAESGSEFSVSGKQKKGGLRITPDLIFGAFAEIISNLWSETTMAIDALLEANPKAIKKVFWNFLIAVVEPVINLYYSAKAKVIPAQGCTNEIQ
ncbi:MAG: polyprenol monophosphomannose synthase [Thermoplasmata archaeon]